MAYQFGAALYRNSREMHTAIAEEWLSGGGLNHRADMLNALQLMSDAELAREAVEGWNLTENEDFEGVDFLAAWADIRADFDKHFPNEG